jgi:hypothetical protein
METVFKVIVPPDNKEIPTFESIVSDGNLQAIFCQANVYDLILRPKILEKYNRLAYQSQNLWPATLDLGIWV